MSSSRMTFLANNPGYSYTQLYHMNMNKRKNYPKLEAVVNPADLSYQIKRDINVRYITVENSSTKNPIGVYLGLSEQTVANPKIDFILQPGQIMHLGVNPMNTVDQFIHLVNPETWKECGPSMVLRHNANQFVLRDGVNMWYVAPFYRAGFRPAK